MGPEDIKRITKARHSLTMAQRAVTSTSLEVNRPVTDRHFELQEQYDASDFWTPEHRQEYGEALKQRTEQLLETLWGQQDNLHIRQGFTYPHKETLFVKVPGFVVMHLTRYTGHGPDAQAEKPAGSFDLEEASGGYWGLYQNNPKYVADHTLDYTKTHARLEDDVATLEAIFSALEIPVPEAQVSNS